ncbi:MAG TPA: amidohydrolase [Thermoanaerobaculia bacterium]|nr:amidohydrolase [Thermoanaerobaculia bacterium]
MTGTLASSTSKRIAEFPPAERERLISTRRDLHRHPELAFEETRTASLVADRLRAVGLSPRSGVGRTGVTADPGPAPGLRRILLRADMDGLPLTEATGAPYASEEPGRMHACGHDGHVAIALAVAERLARAPEAGRFRFLFQPAEEGAGGAEACAGDGVLEGVSAALGLHLWNQLPVGRVGVNRGALMAAVDEFSIQVEGPGGHGAAPHETADTVVAAARIVESLQSVVAREISPLEPAVVTVATIHGGDAFNVIPSSVRLTGTARSFSEATGKALPEKIARIVSGTAAAAGVAARLDYRRVNRATVNDRGVAEIVIREAVRLLGEENVETDTRTLGGEDMSVYLSRVPGCFFFVGSAPEGAHRPHHSPVFDIDERALLLGTLLFEAAALAVARQL